MSAMSAGRVQMKRGLALVGDSIQLPILKTRATAEAWGKKGHSYKPLPKEFWRDGFTYRQIARQNDAAIYEQTWNNPLNHSLCYEVIRIRCRDAFDIGGRFVEAAEVYPNSEVWGTDGFTLTDEAVAFTKLRKIA